MVATTPSISLAAFLTLPETKPASEYIAGKILQKPMPKRKHSLLQSELCTAINAAAKPPKIAYAFPELRCTFGDRSLVPDLVILNWESIEFDADGIPLDDVAVAPDWVIEILSPEQSSNRVTANIAHCLKFGCQLGWLIDPKDQSILILRPDRAPELYLDDERLPVLNPIDLSLTPNQVFNWLRLNNEPSVLDAR
jgi:Uma2 family endonuclease